MPTWLDRLLGRTEPLPHLLGRPPDPGTEAIAVSHDGKSWFVPHKVTVHPNGEITVRVFWVPVVDDHEYRFRAHWKRIEWGQWEHS